MNIQATLKNNPNLYDFLIIGGGPAGLTAAIYGARSGMKVGFIEKGAPGGKMVKTGSIENYPGIETVSGPDLSLKMLNHTLANDVAYIFGEVQNIKQLHQYWHVITQDQQNHYAKAVFIATGMMERKLNIPGETEGYNRGVSYCAVCDGALYKNQHVAVVGGGNSAVEEAIFLAKIAKQVHLIHRRHEYRASAKVVSNMKQMANIITHTPYTPEKIVLTNNKVSGIEVLNQEDHTTKLIPVACVFPYIGLDPLVDFVKDLEITDESGFISVNEHMQTKYPGLYAGGDVVSKSLRQVATAINDGAIAAIHAQNYLSNDFKA